MTINYTTLLGLAQPVTGTEANTWGTVVNDEITALVDSAVAGTTTISADADVTLTTTAGAANQSRQAIILWTAGGTVTRNITAPAQSKVYMVINATSSTQSIVLRGVGPTTGITIVAGERCVAAWNGSDFVKVANQNGIGNFTTVDATNIEVTNIKAKDGTAAGSIADSTGVVTIASSVLTTTDINGGTIDGTAIGGSSAAAGTFTSLSDSGNLTFTGKGNRIIGDFSNATVANRVMFQTSTANSATSIYAIPSGTSSTSQFVAVNNSDPTNASVLQLQVNATDYQIRGGITGTGTYLPMTFYTGGSERARIDINGLTGFGTASATSMLQTAGSSSVSAFKTPNIAEVNTVSATAATGTINYDVTTQSVLYYTTNASGNFTVNFRGSSGTSLNTVMATGESISVTFLVTNGATAYYNSAVQVDGSSVTPKWQGGTAPTSGNASSIDSYTYVIIKTGSATFTVLASQTKFA